MEKKYSKNCENDIKDCDTCNGKYHCIAERGRELRKNAKTHGLEKYWWKNSPHPKRWDQRNCITCPACGIVISYSYRKKNYGFSQEEATYVQIPNCRDYEKQTEVPNSSQS